MTFEAAGYLWAAGLAAAAVVVLHLLARRRPRTAVFPTARFVPERAVRAPAFRRRPSDRLLLALRVAAVLLLGLAFARPGLEGPRTPLVAITIGDSVGSLSAALAAAHRAVGARTGPVDSVALAIASPLTRDQWDAATAAWRATWPGAIRLAATRRPPGRPARVVWPALPGGDTLRAVVVGDLVAVGRWAVGPLPDGVPVAYLEDGTPAAVEVEDGDGCVRHVGIGLPPDDARLNPAFRRLAGRLRSAPCGDVLRDTTPLDSAQLALLAGSGGPAAVADLPRSRPPRRPLAVLILLAVTALGIEQVLRSRLA